ncbi:MAG: oligosaccharide flippase family protein [Cyclobacteriaceae bacterium]
MVPLLQNKLKRNQFNDLMTISLPYVLTYLSRYFMQFIDRLLITSFFSLSTLGLYALVNRIGQVFTFTLQIISSRFRPIITVNYSSQEGQGLSRKIFNVYWIASAPVSIISILIAPLLVNLFWGEQYLLAAPVLPYIVLSVWFLGSFFLFGFAYQIKRKTIYVTLITFSVVILVYLLSLMFIKFSGMLGIAQATTISAALGAFIYIFGSEQLFSFRYSMKLMLVCMLASLVIIFSF